jgi:hypothetical protein
MISVIFGLKTGAILVSIAGLSLVGTVWSICKGKGGDLPGMICLISFILLIIWAAGFIIL